ncbi:ribonuclease HI family protein [Listeria booriae]|uniref:ribonuclease HI family protein n=1 Tax=Listeria booriae TaxID=1552123 RepID=UPI0028800677|nr:ribonuclease HI family protein [Listeria booriae]MDT0110073.1 ribonuclease HI family protein [Listeria booriae]
MEIYVDGASAGDPGLSGIGIMLIADGIYEQISQPIEMMSNHEAEFIAMKTGITQALTYHPTFLRIYSDSKIVVQSIEKRHAKNPIFKPHLDTILQLLDTNDLFFVQWIPSASNKKADDLARQAIQKQKKDGFGA